MAPNIIHLPVRLANNGGRGRLPMGNATVIPFPSSLFGRIRSRMLTAQDRTTLDRTKDDLLALAGGMPMEDRIKLIVLYAHRQVEMAA